MKQLSNGSLLWVKEQRGHVIVGFVAAEELTDGGVDVFSGNLRENAKCLACDDESDVLRQRTYSLLHPCGKR